MDYSQTRVEEIEQVDLSFFKQEIAPLHRPFIFKGFAKNWPVVNYGNESADTLVDYFHSIEQGKEINYQAGSPEIDGRYFYNEDYSGVNFKTQCKSFKTALSDVLQTGNTNNKASKYIASASVAEHMPNLLQHNNDQLLKGLTPGIWIGNKVTIATHFDVPDNIVCCIAGKRRFTLFPPKQINNLYIGPVDLTPAGQPISLVDLKNPDYEKHPKFKEAQKHALVAELEPGDALYIPSLWWHNVESLSPFNVLLSYFHDATPQHFGSPYDCLMHGLLSIRNLPIKKKEAWQAYFNHYLFGEAEGASGHIPPNCQGVLGRQTPQISERLKHKIYS
jgi:hypothetical protein